MTAAVTARKPEVPERGAIIWVDLAPTRGHEQSGFRPAVVLSAGRFNKQTGLAIVVPITSRGRGNALEVAVETATVRGVALASHVRTIDLGGRRIRHDGLSCPEDAVRALQGILITLISGDA